MKKTVLLTGANGDIGFAIAKRLAQEKYFKVLLMWSARTQILDKWYNNMEDFGGDKF